METRINGALHSLDAVRGDETAVELLRERCHLVGTKLACGAGVCGACTIHVDGTPMVSCLLPAHHLDGRSVTTIETYRDQPLHPVQKAFIAHDALQCGYCTPGYIMEGIAFYTRWRAEHGTEAPSRDAIADALAGHMCRCGSYVGIYRAIEDACSGRFDHDEPVAAERVDAADKVTGRAEYTVDVRLDGMLEGVILRSLHPHATVGVIDARAALDLPGVLGFVELVAADRTVRYVGQELGALAAVDRATAVHALKLIRVEYTPLPAIPAPATARSSQHSTVFERGSLRMPSSAEWFTPPGRVRGNLHYPLNIGSRHGRLARRRIGAARATHSPPLVEGTWKTASQIHTPLEPHATVASWDGTQLMLFHSTQSVHLAAREIAARVGLAPERVHVQCAHTGGGFGAKGRVWEDATAAARLTLQLGRPVRVVFDRPEEHTTGGYRPAVEAQIALLANAQQRLAALSATTYTDSGAARGGTVGLIMSMEFPYDEVPRQLQDIDILTNNAPGKPFRAPNAVPANWALEGAIDALATELGADPLLLRCEWDSHPQRRQLYAQLQQHPVWQSRTPPDQKQGRFRRGVGVAAAQWTHHFNASAMVEVSASPAGLTVSSATQEIGTGMRSLLAHAVAEVFGLPPQTINVQIGDSRLVRGPSNSGSRGAASVFEPAQRAAYAVRDELVRHAVARLNLQNPQPVPGGLAHAAGQFKWAELFRQLPAAKAVARRGYDQGVVPLPFSLDSDGMSMGRVHPGAVTLAEVEVDTRLGRIRPVHIWSGIAVGRVYQPALARSQCYGAIIQGLGFALYEERRIDGGSGQVLTTNLNEYHLPDLGSLPEITVIFAETMFEGVRGGGAGLAELAMVGVPAAVANAVYNATGWRPLQAPISMARLIDGLAAESVSVDTSVNDVTTGT